MEDAIRETLSRLALCRTLTPEQLGSIAALFEGQDVALGEWLFHDGDPATALYVVVEGKMEVVKEQPGGDYVLARLGSGAVFGEMALVTEENRSAGVRATSPSHVLRLSRTRFQGMIRGDGLAALKMVAEIAAVLARRLTLMNEKTVELSRKLSGQRTEDLAEFQRALQAWQL